MLTRKEDRAAVHSNTTDDVGKERAVDDNRKAAHARCSKVTVQSSEANPYDQTARLPAHAGDRLIPSRSLPHYLAVNPGLFSGWNAAEIRSSCSTLRGYLPPCDTSARYGESCAY